MGPPRSGMTIVTQFLNDHKDIKIFDEIDLIQVGRFGEPVIGTLQAFLAHRGVYDAYLQSARDTQDPALALRTIMSQIAQPCTIWGEKNPRYAARRADLERRFPEAMVLFVLRDPREVVNSCLLHQNSPSRSPTDFWIKDTVAEALAQLESSLEPLHADDPELAVLRYEDFVARPKATLDATLGRWGLTFADGAAQRTLGAPETVGDHQFYRDGAPLPWKVGNLSPLRQTPSTRDRVDADDPVWAQVDALARRFGYV
nr:sulfotransferase [Mycobacterium sp.]